jgi:hypothetical protein
METIDINEIKQCLKDYFQGREEVEDIQLVTSPCRLPICKLNPPTSGQYASKGYKENKQGPSPQGTVPISYYHNLLIFQGFYSNLKTDSCLKNP